MEKQTSKKMYYLRRFFEILPGFLSWLTLLAIVPLSMWTPVFVAVFVILYDLSWLIKVVHISTHLVYSHAEARRTRKTNYISILEKLDDKKGYRDALQNKLAKLDAISKKKYSASRLKIKKRKIRLGRLLADVQEMLQNKDTDLKWRDVYHVVVFPTAKESINVLRASIDALIESGYPLDRIMVVMAFEERSGDLGKENARILQEEYGDIFHTFSSYFHPSDIPGEIKAKSSNMTYAMREFTKKIDELGIPYENILVSAFDSDTQVAPEYLGCLTYHFIKNPNRTRASYQPIPVYHNNLWDVPAMGRVAALGSTFWQMIEASRPQRLITFSSHAMSMKALVEVDYWPVDVISEDSQIFWRCYLHYNGEYYVEPMFTTVSMDATDGETYLKAHVAQYNQKKRWFWGIENFPYVSLGFLKNKKIPAWKKIAQWLRMLDSFYTLATAPIILALGGWLPVYLGGEEFQQSVVSQNLGILTQVLTTLALVGLLITFAISMLIIPRPPKDVKRHRRISIITQWLLVPIATVIFGAIPAIDSQTRLMTKKYIGEFWVTDKTRKE